MREKDEEIEILIADIKSFNIEIETKNLIIEKFEEKTLVDSSDMKQKSHEIDVLSNDITSMMKDFQLTSQ